MEVSVPTDPLAAMESIQSRFFFFEIVERRGNGRFGAINTSIRMAARARDLPKARQGV